MDENATRMKEVEGNPYAAPRVAMRVGDVRVGETMGMRWFFIVLFSLTGLYQVVGGAGGVWSAFVSPSASRGFSASVNSILGPCLLVTGVMGLYVVWCLLVRRWSRGIFWMGLVTAFMTWLPFLILNVVPVMLWMLNRPGRVVAKRWRGKARVAMPVEEAVRVVKTEAMLRFGVRGDQLGVPLVRGLKFAPGEVGDFLTDMEVDHGIALADAVDVSRVSVEEMLEVVAGMGSC